MPILTAAFTGLVVAVSSQGQLIDFETLPDGAAPVDDQPLPLDAAYEADGVEVSFGWDSDGDRVADTAAQIEQRGGGPPGAERTSGFFRCGEDGRRAQADEADPEFVDLLGEFMLRRPVPFASDWSLVVAYSGPVQAASGAIWDIDHNPVGYERWRVDAYLGDDLIETVSSPPENELPMGPCASFDGEPWFFSFQPAGGLDRIVVSFIGTQPNPGFVFDSFNATSAIATCPGDINGDGAIGAADLALLLAAWGPAHRHPADLDSNGEVDAADLAGLLAAWGKCD